MNILVKRDYKKDTYTIGNLYIDNKWFCNTLEDKDRGLKDTMSIDEIAKIKIKDKTAIPTGTYKVTLNVISPKFSKYPFYKSINNGRVPRILNVKGFDGILFHVMDGYKGADLSSGCIGIGKNKIKGGLLEGRETYKKFYDILQKANNITLTIC